MPIYIRKPERIEVVEYTGENLEEIKEFAGKNLEVLPTKSGPYIVLHFGITKAVIHKGVWIVKDEFGNCFAASNKYIQDNYQPI